MLVDTTPRFGDVVVFPADAGPSLSAAIVEQVSFFLPYSEVDAGREKRVADGFAKFAESIMADPEADDGMVGGWGRLPAFQEGVSCRRYTTLMGWKSYDAHFACKKTAVYKDNVHHLKKTECSLVATVDMAHYKYSASAGL